MNDTTITLAVAVGAFISVLCAVFALGDLITRTSDRLKAKYIEQTEMELEEMLIQLPAKRLINHSLIIAGLLAFFMFIVGSLAGRSFSPQSGAMLGIITFAGILGACRGLIILLKKRRLEKFNDQLEDALLSMSNALKAGFSITQAIEMVIKQNLQPISIEFKLMLQQTKLGMTFDQALQNMAERVNSEDFFLVSTAIATARQTGGDLTGIFDRLAALIRERLRIQRKITSMTAQGRLQGIVLGLLPLVLLLVFFVLDPSLIQFFSTPKGIILLIIVLLLETFGYLTIRKIMSIDI